MIHDLHEEFSLTSDDNTAARINSLIASVRHNHLQGCNPKRGKETIELFLLLLAAIQILSNLNSISIQASKVDHQFNFYTLDSARSCGCRFSFHSSGFDVRLAAIHIPGLQLCHSSNITISIETNYKDELY